MIEQYIEAVRDALGGVLHLLTQWALPLAIGLGIVGAASLRGRRREEASAWAGRRAAMDALGWACVGLTLVAGWAGLRAMSPLAQGDLRWRENAEATKNPVPDAPAVLQSGPAVAALTARTYTRTLTLPPYFLDRLGSEGVGVLAPYLSDPSAQNVLRLRDTFRRSGRDVVFTREATLLEEEPIPFSDSRVSVTFRRLAGRAYDAVFEGHYTFQNASGTTQPVHFLFTLPQAGTLRDLSVVVGGQTVSEPSRSAASDTYEWKRDMAPGETREAVVRYRVVGGRTWSYDIGSPRRRVQQFHLEAHPNGEARFLRGSLQPSSQGRTLTWNLSNVVTAQQVAIAFPEDLGDQLYLQALSALPAAFALFFVGVLAVGYRFAPMPGPARILVGLVVFAFGLGAASVLTPYLGAVAGILVGPLVGAGLAAAVLGRRALLAAVPVALLPAAFLSAQNSGLIVLLLSALAFVSAWLLERRAAAATRRAEG